MENPLNSTKQDGPIDKRYVVRINDDGKEDKILKSSVIWALTESKGFLSKDRLKRVQARENTGSPNQTPKKRKRDNQTLSDEDYSVKRKRREQIRHENLLKIGDWCLFQDVCDGNEVQNFVLGMVLGFKYIEGNTEKKKQCRFDFVPTSADGTSERGIEVLSTLFNLDSEFVVRNSLDVHSFFINIEKYIATIQIPLETQKQIMNHQNVKIDVPFSELEPLIHQSK